MRKAIEDVNSGNLKPPQPEEINEFEKKPFHPQEEPLLDSHKKANSTVTSMDSALSNSDNCSDIEMDSIETTHTLKSNEIK